MTVPPLDLDQLGTYQRARFAAETLDRATINTEVNDLERNINDLRWSRNFGQSVKLFPFERRTGFYGQGYAEAIYG